MANRAKRPRISQRIHMLDHDAVIYSIDNTQRKRKVPAVCMATIRDGEITVGDRTYYAVEDHAKTDFFPYSKISRMIYKALNKGKVFIYRDENLSDEQHLNTTPANKPVDLDKAFRKQQRRSQRMLEKHKSQNAQEDTQALTLQVA